MDSRIYFHQNRRPRYNNPTYISNNVNNSLTFFNSKRSQPYEKQMYGNYLNEKINTIDRHNNRNIDNYTNMSMNINNSQETYKNFNTINNPQQNRQYRGQSLQNRSSNLSSYGSNSITLNQKDIFNKQNQKFDIISMRPKNFDTSIRQYPAFTLQNKDELYYQRMIENTKKKYDNDQSMKRNYQKNHQNRQEIIAAGKHTYGSKTNKNNKQYINQYQNYKQQSNNYTNPEYQTERPNQKNRYFDPKMLNHMDQLSSLS